MPEYTKEQLLKLYKDLPADLKEAIFSAENADHIYEVVIRNGLAENQVPEVAARIGNVLLGLLPPSDFQATLEKELKLEKTTARKILQEINRFIFFPVKQSLAEIYKVGLEEVASTTPTPGTIAAEPTAAEEPTVTRATKRKAETEKADTYREPIE